MRERDRKRERDAARGKKAHCVYRERKKITDDLLSKLCMHEDNEDDIY